MTTILIVSGIIGLVIAASYFSTKRQIVRKLRSTQRSPIAEVLDDRVAHVVGRAQPLEQLLVAPLSGRPCVYHFARCEERRSTMSTRTSQGTSWDTIMFRESVQPFVLDDGTGHAMVIPTGAWVMIETIAGPFDGERAAAFVAEAHPTGEVRFQEGVIMSGEMIHVLGAATREHDPDPEHVTGYREAPVRLRFESTKRGRLVICSDRRATNGS